MSLSDAIVTKSTGCVLVVDDDLISLETYARAFRLEGIRVSTAASIQEARDLVQSDELGFVISDRILPDGDGIDLLRFTRSQGSIVPFVVLTGFPTRRSFDEAKALGVLAYLTKPFWIDDLITLVKEQLSGAGQRACLQEPETVAAKAMSIVETRFRDTDLRPRAIATELSVSPAHLSRTFRTTYGKQLVVALREKRLDEAAQLFATSRMMVKEVSHACGYRLVEHFARDYRRRFGRTPGRLNP